jgi:hypothetical protein
MPRPKTALSAPHVAAALILGLFLFAANASAETSSPRTSDDKSTTGVEKLEGIWKIEPLGGGRSGIDFIRFGAGNSAQWFHFESEQSCWTSRHQYRLVRDRMIFTPPLSEGRSWWQPNFETPARIELLERIQGEAGRSSQRVRLIRAALYQGECEVREPAEPPG